jgi:acetyl esterase/lipase
MRVPASVFRHLVRLSARSVTGPGVPFGTQRRRYELIMGLQPSPRGTTVTSELVGGVPCDRVTARGADPRRTVVHLHGGGFCIGSARSHRSFAAWLSRATGVSVVLVDYRLAPEHPYPAGPDDAEAAWRGLADSAVALSGDSAGGHLAVLVALRMLESGGPVPRSLVLISPAMALGTDHRSRPDLVASDVMLAPEWTERCFAAYSPRDPEQSLLDRDLSGLPRTLVVAATAELLLLDADAFSAAARGAGVEVTDIRGEGLWHIYPTQAGRVRAADDAVARIAAFVGKGP